MKILHITEMSPLNPNSGIPEVLKQLTNAQNKLPGVEALVLCLRKDKEKIDSTYFHYLEKGTVLSFLKKYQPDIAIMHGFFSFEFIAATRALVKAGIPFYSEPHGSFGRQAMKKSWLKKSIANHTIFRQQIKRSRGYIFLNNSERDNSIYRTDSDLVIPNGVEPEIVSNARSKDDASMRDPQLYYLGRFDIHHKGLDYLLDALDILEHEGHHFQVNLYGKGTDQQIDYINSKIQKFKNMKVVNCGPIYGDEKKKALEANNILLLTSRYEGFPMTVLEGLLYGNPCIVTPGTNVSEEVSENKLGWRTVLDPKSIAKTIVQAREMYISDSEGYCHRCKDYVLNHYSWDRIAKFSVEQLQKQL